MELGVEHRGAGDLFPVVILGVHPEHRDDRGAEHGLGTARELQRRDGLQDGEQRAAEHPGLLAGDDRHGLRIGQPPRGVGRGGGRAPAGLLSGEAPGNRRPVVLLCLDP